MACGNGGASSTRTRHDDGLPDVDPNLMTAVSLQPSDLAPGFIPEFSFNPPGASATGYSAVYRIKGLSITSNVVKYPDTAARDKDLSHNRGGFAKIIGPESAYRLPGSDAAFLYTGG